MAINKVDLFGETLVDLTDSTVSENDLMDGVTAYDASGDKITGVLKTQNYFTGTTPPSSSLGDDGDLYLMTDETDYISRIEALEESVETLQSTTQNQISDVKLNNTSLQKTNGSVNIEAVTSVQLNGTTLTKNSGTVNVQAITDVKYDGTSLAVSNGSVSVPRPTWVKIGSTTGQSALTFDCSAYNELHICVSSDSTKVRNYTITIPTADLNSSSRFTTTGYFNSTTDYGMAQVDVVTATGSNVSVTLASAHHYNASVLTKAVTTVFGR